jgi:hypothetical protein
VKNNIHFVFCLNQPQNAIFVRKYNSIIILLNKRQFEGRTKATKLNQQNNNTLRQKVKGFAVYNFVV